MFSWLISLLSGRQSVPSPVLLPQAPVLEGEICGPINSNRPRCPFYGFVGVSEIFVDNQGDACGLARGHSSCVMETKGKAPSWEGCRTFNHMQNAPRILELQQTGRVFPTELCPEGQTTWDGLSLGKWWELVMGRERHSA